MSDASQLAGEDGPQATAADAYGHAADMAATLAAKARYGYTKGPCWVRAEYVDHLAAQLTACADQAREQA